MIIRRRDAVTLADICQNSLGDVYIKRVHACEL